MSKERVGAWLLASVVLFVGLGMAVHLNGQQAGPASQPSARPANRCNAPEYQQVDFLIGTWQVSNSGKSSADVAIERTTTSDCGLLETWHSASGGGGNGLFGYSPVAKAWDYFWVPSSGQPTWLQDGKPTGNPNELQFTLTRTQPDGSTHESHWTITKTPDGHIHEVSVNAATGKGEYDLLWTKKP